MTATPETLREALEAIADGEGDAQEIARQTLAYVDALPPPAAAEDLAELIAVAERAVGAKASMDAAWSEAAYSVHSIARIDFGQAFDPPTVLALLRSLASSRAEVERLTRMHRQSFDLAVHHQTRAEAAEARIAALEGVLREGRGVIARHIEMEQTAWGIADMADVMALARIDALLNPPGAGEG